MITQSEIEGLIDIFKNLGTKKAEVLEFLRDTTIPIETRWDIFKRLPDNLVNNDPWIVRYKSLEEILGDVSYYDDFYIERYETVDMVALVNNINNYSEVIQKFYEKNPEKLNDFKEEILATGIRSWQHDW